MLPMSKCGRPDTAERNIAITRDLLNGMSMVATGNKYGITGERVRQIARKICRRITSEHFKEMTPPEGWGKDQQFGLAWVREYRKVIFDNLPAP